VKVFRKGSEESSSGSRIALGSSDRIEMMKWAWLNRSANKVLTQARQDEQAVRYI
jgi:hypothetical protein